MKTIKSTLEQVREYAERFLKVADELEELVSAYIDGSDDSKCEMAYIEVKNAEAEFLTYYNAYYDDNIKPALNYEVAESVLD